MVHQKEITLNTGGPRDIQDLTPQIERIVRESKVRAGLVNVFNLGSTAAIGLIEMEPGLMKDLPQLLERLIPPGPNYWHEQTWHDGNGHSHLQATLLGQGLTVPIRDGVMALGTWQQIFHLECDVRSRVRTIVVTVTGA